MKQPNSEKKAKQIAEYESQPYRVGDTGFSDAQRMLRAAILKKFQ